MNNQGGFIKTIVLIIVIILILGYFDISVRSIVEKESVRDNFSYVWNHLKSFWYKYLAGPADYFWNDFVVDLLWESFIENLERIKGGQDTTLMEASPWVPGSNPNN